MARPLPLEIAPRNAREELRRRLDRASDEHAEAILDAFQLLQEMHDQGVLEMARGMLGARDEILGTLAKDASTPEAVRAIRNLPQAASAAQSLLGPWPDGPPVTVTIR